MKLTAFAKGQDQKAPALLSLALHVVAIALLASLFGPRVAVPTERIRYVQTQPAPSREIGNGSNPTEKPRRAVAPAPLVSPTVVPEALPPVAPPAASAGAISGTSTGTGGAPTGIATGIEPAMPDPRIELRPNTLRLPLTTAQRNDSAVKAIYMAYREAEIEAAARAGRDPRDWTFERNGGKYGVDSSYIYLGKFKLPSAILAALPFNFGGVDGRRIIDGRNAAWIQNDIYTHSQGLSEDDFRAAIRRIRERKDKERRDADEGKKPVPIVP